MGLGITNRGSGLLWIVHGFLPISILTFCLGLSVPAWCSSPAPPATTVAPLIIGIGPATSCPTDLMANVKESANKLSALVAADSITTATEGLPPGVWISSTATTQPGSLARASDRSFANPCTSESELTNVICTPLFGNASSHLRSLVPCSGVICRSALFLGRSGPTALLIFLSQTSPPLGARRVQPTRPRWLRP